MPGFGLCWLLPASTWHCGPRVIHHASLLVWNWAPLLAYTSQGPLFCSTSVFEWRLHSAQVLRWYRWFFVLSVGLWDTGGLHDFFAGLGIVHWRIESISFPPKTRFDDKLSDKHDFSPSLGEIYVFLAWICSSRSHVRPYSLYNHFNENITQQIWVRLYYCLTSMTRWKQSQAKCLRFTSVYLIYIYSTHLGT